MIDQTNMNIKYKNSLNAKIEVIKKYYRLKNVNETTWQTYTTTNEQQQQYPKIIFTF